MLKHDVRKYITSTTIKDIFTPRGLYIKLSCVPKTFRKEQKPQFAQRAIYAFK